MIFIIKPPRPTNATLRGSSTGSGWINFSIDSRIMITQRARRNTALMSDPNISLRPQPNVFCSDKTRSSIDLFEICVRSKLVLKWIELIPNFQRSSSWSNNIFLIFDQVPWLRQVQRLNRDRLTTYGKHRPPKPNCCRGIRRTFRQRNN